MLFNGAVAVFTNALTNNIDLRITAIVPPDATSGPITVITPRGNVTSAASFSVLPPPLPVSVLADGSIRVAWDSTSPEFAIESSDAVTGSPWTAVNAAVQARPGGSTVQLSADGRTRFLRLMKAAR